MKYLAQDQIKDYQMLTPLPDVRTGNPTGGINEFQGYIPNLFNLIIGLAIVIAVGWIIFGGVQYMTTDSWTGKEEGKNKIKNSIIGLIIIICSYLILNTINPRILDLNLDLRPTEVPTTVTTGGGAGGGGITSCTDCVAITGVNVKSGSGTQISSQILPNLQALGNDIPNWQITEGNPPTFTHKDQCHTNGTCVDANFVDSSPLKVTRVTTANASNLGTGVDAFLSASTKNGLSASYEVTTAAEKTLLLNSGKISAANASKIVVNEDASAPHFHVEKH